MRSTLHSIMLRVVEILAFKSIIETCIEIASQGRIGYAGTHVPMSVPRLGLIKPDICLSQIMGFFQKNYSLAYFAFFLESSSGLS